jgi:hypothetical protein
MDHTKIQELISSYFDGGLDDEEKKAVQDHIRTCSPCRKEFEEMKRFEEVMGKMELKNPGKEVWDLYWGSIYNKLERRFGWILLSIGGMILLFFGAYKMIEKLITDPSLPLLLKAGILLCLAGLVVLLFSFGREQIFVHKRERYKEVEK